MAKEWDYQIDEWVYGIKVRIRKAREDKGISIKTLAEKVGVTQVAVYAWEGVFAKNLPSIDHIIDICEVLDISIDWLLTGKERK